VLVPLGATEQHGPHLPLETDSLIGAELAVRVARHLGHAFAAPVLPLGASAEHREFPGTLSLSHETVAAVIVDLSAWLWDRGFRRVVVFSAHGGNRRALELARTAVRPGTIVLPDLPSVSVSAGDAHAGCDETSMLLAIAPEAVRPVASAGYRGRLDADSWSVLTTAGVRALAPNGVLGDPTEASAELGQALLEALASAIAATILERTWT
jgi:mycofactocin system creatininase family protein